MKSPLVSIIICTYNRSEELTKICLPSLKEVEYDNLEIIVVDSSINDIEENREHTERIGGRYLHYPVRGLSNARNFGIKKSIGEFIAFTDDDCVVNVKWVEKMMLNFTDSQVACCTGRTLPYSDAVEAERIWEAAKSFDRGADKKFVRYSDLYLRKLFSIEILSNLRNSFFGPLAPAPWSLGLGNNMIFRKSIFETALGFFDQRLGRGTNLETGEELDMYYRILRNNYVIVYEPDAIIYHKHRQTENDVLVAGYTAGLGISAFVSKYFRDPYMMMCYLGRLINLLVALICATRNISKIKRNIMLEELKGWIYGPAKFRFSTAPIFHELENTVR